MFPSVKLILEGLVCNGHNRYYEHESRGGEGFNPPTAVDEEEGEEGDEFAIIVLAILRVWLRVMRNNSWAYVFVASEAPECNCQEQPRFPSLMGEFV